MTAQLRQKLSIIYFAFFASSWVYLLIGGILYRLPWQGFVSGSNLANIFVAIFLLAAVSILMILSARISKSRSEFAHGAFSEPAIVSSLIILLALSEVPAILALVLFLLTAQWLVPLVLWLISLICFLFVRPSRILPAQQ